MILYICYNQKCESFKKDVVSLISEKYPQIKLETFNEDHYKEKKNAYRIKGGYSARLTPFALLTEDDKTYVKAFYSENKGCNLDDIDNILYQLNLNSDFVSTSN